MLNRCRRTYVAAALAAALALPATAAPGLAAPSWWWAWLRSLWSWATTENAAQPAIAPLVAPGTCGAGDCTDTGPEISPDG